MANLGTVVIKNKEEMLDLFNKVLPCSSIAIIGDGGIGKTVLVEDLKGKELGYASKIKIDEVRTLRISSMNSEDFSVPYLEEINEGKVVKKEVALGELGILKEVKENPDKNFVIFIDEINRADDSLEKILFSLSEGRNPQGEKLSNLFVVAAMNFGDAYNYTLQFDDKALLSRFVFVEYAPDNSNFETYGLHKKVKEVAEIIKEKPAAFVNFETSGKKDAVFEQSTNYRSFKKWSTFLTETEAKIGTELSYEQISDDLLLMSGKMFFNPRSVDMLTSALMFLETTKAHNWELIIEKGITEDDLMFVDQKGNEQSYSRNEIVSRICLHIKDEMEKDLEYLNKIKKGDTKKIKKINKIADFFNEEQELPKFLALIQDMKEHCTREKKAGKFFTILTQLTKDLKGDKEKVLIFEALKDFTKLIVS